MVGYCHYVLSHLNNFYEDELEMLAILSRGDVEQFKEYEAHFPSDTIPLRRYGLVELKEGAPRIRIPLLGKYFKSGSVRSLGVIKGAHEAGKKHIKRGNNPSADVFVFAALNEELEALIEQIGGQPKQWSPTPNSPYLFLEGEILMPGAYRPLRYVLGTPDEVGAAPVQNLMHHALKRFNPRYVLQACISAGVRGVVELGDIVVADQVVDYSMGKRTVDGVQHHHQVWPSCKYLRSLAATMRMKGLTNGWWTTNMAERPDVHIGTVATGPFVLADGGTIGNLRKSLAQAAWCRDGGGRDTECPAQLRHPARLYHGQGGIGFWGPGEERLQAEVRMRELSEVCASAFKEMRGGD